MEKLPCNSVVILIVIFILKESCLISYFECETAGLEPSGVIPVCPGGDVELNCTTLSRFQEWRITVFTFNGTSEIRRLRVDELSVYMDEPFLMSSFFNFYVTSISINPLVSNLYTKNVSITLNGAVIECGAVQGDSSLTNVSEATIHVIRLRPYYFTTLFVTMKNVSYSTDHVFETLDLHWIQEDLVTYTVRAIPNVNVNFTSPTTVQLMLLYNTAYNVNITATLCSKRAWTYRDRYYIKCNTLTRIVDTSVQVDFDDRQPALEGTAVSFSCPPGLMLNRPNMTICMENGEWEPDPREVKCQVDCGLPIIGNVAYNSTLEGSTLLFLCEDNRTMSAMCDKSGKWIPDPDDANVCLSASNSRTADSITVSKSTLAAVIISVVLFGCVLFIAGSVCGCLCHKYKHLLMKMDRVPEISGSTRDQSELEMTENVAYGPVKHGRAQ